MGGSVVHHRLVDRVRRLVGEDARGQTRHQLFHLVDAAALHHVVVDQNIFAEELHFVLKVAEQPSHLPVGNPKRNVPFSYVTFVGVHHTCVYCVLYGTRA